MAAGPLFVGVPLTLVGMVRRDMADGPSYVVMTLMFAWFSDTGGYFAGRFLGKHKLYEAVSPKKTVEGALGGLAGSVLGALFAHFVYLPAIPLAHAIPLALVAGAFGQAGDLAESLVKRSTGVKDSGAIVPGHGGILDRVDALLYAVEPGRGVAHLRNELRRPFHLWRNRGDFPNVFTHRVVHFASTHLAKKR
jgi:phosphatidate cytidylyltransferase